MLPEWVVSDIANEGVPVEIHVEPIQPEGYLVRLKGDLDLRTAGKLQQALDDLMSAVSVPIIVNLTEVPFMDSTGIAAFLRTRQANHHSGSRLIVVTPSRDLHRVLQITGVSDMLTLVGTEGEALAAL